MKNKTTKAELVEQIYSKALIDYRSTKKVKCPYNKEDISNLFGIFIDTLSSNLKEGKSIEIRGLGTFELRKRAARANTRNPKTGVASECKEHSVVVFKSGKELKEAVWGI